MITLTTEQAQQIEEVLVGAIADSNAMGWITISMEQSLTIIRAARAQEQAEQEPVGDVVLERMGAGDAQIVRFQMYGKIPPVGTKLYATPVRTKDLTEAEIDEIWKKHSGGNLGFAYAVIAADREKNK